MASGKSYIVPTTEEPTFFNREMLLGTLLFPIVGTAIGGFIGKERMESEQAAGVLVKPPSRWNLSALNGFLIGSHIGALAGTALLMTVTFAAPLMAGWAALGALGLLAAGTIIGTLAGGDYQKRKMDALYEQGQRNEAAKGITPVKERIPQIGLGQQPAPGELESTRFRDMVGAGQGRGKGF